MGDNRSKYARHILKASSVVALNLAAVTITSGVCAQSLGDSVATAFGGGAAYDNGTGAFTLPSYLVQGITFDNVGGALNKLDASVDLVGVVAAGAAGAAAANTLVLIDLRNGEFGPFRSDNTSGAANPNAGGDDSTAGGFGASASADQSLALGNSSSASGLNSVALGFGSVATQANTVSMGDVGSERRIVNVDAGTLAAGSTDAVNGGQLFNTNQTTADALGGGAGVDADGNLTGPTYLIQGGSYNNVGSALGALDAQTTTNTNNITILQTEINNGTVGPFRADNTAGAAAPVASGANAVAGGFGAVATASGATAIGSGAQATMAGATAIGAGAVASGDPTTAVGFNATATGNEASAFGAFATATGANSSAIGRSATATGINATAIGVQSNSGGANSIAFGQGASAQQSNTIAIGTGVSTSRANQVAIGSAGQTYTLAGVASTQSAAAQNGPTNFVTSDASGNLATSSYGPASLASMDGRITNLEAGVAAVSQYAYDTRREARQGVAAAMAMASAPLPSAPGKLSYVFNGASYLGEYAMGGSLAYRLGTDLPLAVTAGVSAGGGGDVGVRLGIMGEL